MCLKSASVWMQVWIINFLARSKKISKRYCFLEYNVGMHYFLVCVCDAIKKEMSSKEMTCHAINLHIHASVKMNESKA